jgi:drug/metabolite transporter (DMT)-like permease
MIIYPGDNRIMQNTALRYLYNVYITTLLTGLSLGVLVLYIKDKNSGTYNDDWDNPFDNFVMFFLIGFGESIIPLLIFLVVGKLIISKKINHNWLYIAGLVCTILPFWQLYYMVNEGYHRTNVVIYFVCFVMALFFSYQIYKKQLLLLYD